MTDPVVSEDRTELSCTAHRAAIQSLVSECLAVRYMLDKGPLTIVQKDLLDCLREKLEDLWTVSTARLSHDELDAEGGQHELLIMDQCPVGRPLA